MEKAGFSMPVEPFFMRGYDPGAPCYLSLKLRGFKAI